jgi:Flp pilus assembly CpaE family ATPase
VLEAPLAELVESGRIRVVANRLRSGLVAGNPLAGVTLATRQHTGIAPEQEIPFDLAAADTAHGRGQLLSEAAPHSALRQAITQLTGTLWAAAPSQSDVPKKGRRRRIRPARRSPASSRYLAGR